MNERDEKINEDKENFEIAKGKKKSKLKIIVLIVGIIVLGMIGIGGYARNANIRDENLIYDDCWKTTNELIKKPIIYLYPEQEMKVSVKLGNPELITCSYPKYTTGWKVLAKENGDLLDLVTRKNLYALYYESANKTNFKVEKDGFVVKGEDSAKFLEEKLAILGLTEREAEEFIVYWLPQLETNQYNYIRFATIQEIEENMPLEIEPKPDTVIRIWMTYKGLGKEIQVNEQKLETPERKGFVTVEWGGTEILN